MKTPYFVLYKDKIEKNYLTFRDLCKKYFNNFEICYSVKTNSLKNVVNTLASSGCGFEVASSKEIELIKNHDNFTVFNGACKTENELKIAINNHFLINVDSKSEIDKISKILNRKSLDIGIRLSMEKSKFGIDSENLEQIIKYAHSKDLNVISIHLHSGTQNSLKKFSESLSVSLDFLKKLDLDLKYIDIGGGFPDNFQLKNIGLSLDDYFNEIKKLLNGFNATIIFEPGRNLVCDTMDLITKIEVIKENFGEKYIVLDAGINILSKITLSNFRFVPLKKTKQKDTYILAGPLLFSNDVLGKIKGDFEEGDLIRVENVGAYCYNLAWEISYDKPKVFLE